MRQATSAQLRQARAECLSDAKKLSDKGRLSSTEKREFDQLMREAGDHKRQYEELESRAMGGFRGGPVDGGGRQTDAKAEEHRAAFGSYLRSGLQGMPGEQRSVLQEYRDMGSGGQGAYPGATSGFFVPVGLVQDVISAMKFTGPMADPAYTDLMETETGAPLPYPTDNDTTVVGERVGEGQQVTSADVSLGQLMLGSWKYSSRLVKVSIELLQDSAFDMEKFLIQKFALRLGRILNSDFTVGTGSAASQPLGLITSTLASGNLVAAVGSAANDGTSAGANSIESLVAGAPDMFGGYPLLINNYMDILQSGPNSPPITKNSVIFGNLKRYLVRRVKG